jgi:hypothetical protein
MKIKIKNEIFLKEKKSTWSLLPPLQIKLHNSNCITKKKKL